MPASDSHAGVRPYYIELFGGLEADHPGKLARLPQPGDHRAWQPLVVTRGQNLCLRGKQLAPAARADVALDEFARIRRLEVVAAAAALVAVWRTLIFGVRLTDLLLRRRSGDRSSGYCAAERKRRTGENRSARDALAVISAVIHDRLPQA